MELASSSSSVTPPVVGAPRNETPKCRPRRQWAEIPLRSPVSAHRDRPYVRNAANYQHFERDPIPYALETDWPVGAAGFEPLHLRIRSADVSWPETSLAMRVRHDKLAS